MGNIFKNASDFFNWIKNLMIFEDKKYAPQVKHADYSHLYNRDNFFPDQFYLNLIKTINWTEKIVGSIEDMSQINFSTILRFTNPNYEGKPFYSFNNTYCNFATTPELSFNYLTVISEALAVRYENDFKFDDINEFGQILEFDIDLTTHDGAPSAASEGFVDESDIPPIDTWFYLSKTKLYCWIPKMFVEKMQDAIDVEIFDSYRWIKDSNIDLQLKTINKLKSLMASQNKRFENG